MDLVNNSSPYHSYWFYWYLSHISSSVKLGINYNICVFKGFKKLAAKKYGRNPKFRISQAFND